MPDPLGCCGGYTDTRRRGLFHDACQCRRDGEANESLALRSRDGTADISSVVLMGRAVGHERSGSGQRIIGRSHRRAVERLEPRIACERLSSMRLSVTGGPAELAVTFFSQGLGVPH